MLRTMLARPCAFAAMTCVVITGCGSDAPQFSDATSRMESKVSVELDLMAEVTTGAQIGSPDARHHDVACYTSDGDEFVCEAFVVTSAATAARGRYRVERTTGEMWRARRTAGDATYFPNLLRFPE